MQRIGRYEVRERIAAGAMGVVFLGHDPQLDREVAIKVVSAGAGANELQRKRFLTECRALARLGHPNIVRVHDVGLLDGTPYMVMDLVHGETLQDRVDHTGPLGQREVATLGSKLARALQHAHDQGVLHRDVKPANVIQTPNGEPLLTDFGLARDLEEGAERITQTGVWTGTPGYWSPEQARGRHAELGPASDVYSLGATLYTLLTGEPLYTSSSLVEALQQAGRPPTRPSKLRTDLDRELESVVLTCLAGDPADRYPSGAALADDLESWLEREPATSSLPLAWIVGAVALLAGLALVVAAVVYPSGPPPERSETPAPPSPAPAKTADTAPETPNPLSAPAPDPARAKRRAAARKREFARILKRGQLRAQQGNMEPAYRDLRRAVALDPSSSQAHFTLGTVAVILRRFDEALRACNRAVALEPKSALAHYSRGMVRQARKDLHGAIGDFTKSLELSAQLEPGSDHALGARGVIGVHIILGKLYLQVDQLSGARAHLDAALKAQPNLDDALFTRARVRSRQGDDPGALEDLQAARRLKPNDVTILTNLGMVLANLGKYPRAAATFRRAIKIQPTDALHRRRGLIRYHAGNRQGAFQDLRRAIELAPDVPNNHLWLFGLGQQVSLDAVVGESPAGRVAQHLLGKLSAKQVLNGLQRQGATRRQLAAQDCAVLCFLGLKAERDADLPQARDYYKRAVATNARGMLEFTWALIRLRKLRRD